MAERTCGDRYRDAVNTHDCRRHAGHLGDHEAQPDGGESITWPQTTAPAAANPQAAQGRRDAIDHLLFRAACGVLKAEEGALLRTLVEQERDAGDSLAGGISASAATYARRYEKAAERLRKARQQRNEARADAERLGAALADMRRARNAAVERANRNGAALTAAKAAAKAEAEGLAETMRNTDRLTTEDRKRTRHSLAEARRLRDEACGALDAHQLAVSEALGLGTSAPWDAITERAREVRGLAETRGLATVRPMPALADSARYMFGAAGGLTTGGPLTAAAIRSAAQRAEAAERKLAETTAQRDSAASALTDLRNDLYAERAAHEEHRRELATILNAGRETAWSALLGTVAARNADWARCREEAERSAAADVAAARQAEELAGNRLAMRHDQLADALHCDTGMSWRDLIQLAGDRTGIAAAMRLAVTRAEQNAAAARQGEAEAVRARQAAEAQRRDVLGLLNETERQLGEARRQAEVWRVDAATQAQIAAQRTEERDQLAKRAESLRGQRDRWRTHAHQAVAGFRSEMAAEHTCPDGEPCPAHDQPTEQQSTDAAVRGVQGWMALDLHTALGRPTDHHVTAAHQGHGSWADWWADLLAEVRTRRGRRLGEPYLAVTLNATLTPEQVAEAMRRTRIPGRGGW